MVTGSMNIPNEKKIAEQCKKLITKYNVPSAAERFKKRVELFHLLVCFGQLHRTYRKIEPHDPGDFIVRDETGTHMFEIVTIFGNREAYRVIEAYFEKLFQHGRPREERIHLITSFEENMDKLKELLITKMWEKNEKDYFKCHDYKTANLLLATAEYDRKKAQFPWFLSLASGELQEVVARKNFTRCYVLDYTAARAEVFDMERELLAYDEYLRESGAAYGRRKGGEAPDL
ncbi:hypothetical protein [Christensenella minuta]|uniref:Uncharacterized protein n=2 Tax=Christensenella minuta TaxID=626937 RepID=A0A136Q7J8_9FIRM|nr:hypothetical protein [Christensenella minuta]KXK66645.1 hypothetical protein HMPREF3293_00476 [Christensenella minuta]